MTYTPIELVNWPIGVGKSRWLDPVRNVRDHEPTHSEPECIKMDALAQRKTRLIDELNLPKRVHDQEPTAKLDGCQLADIGCQGQLTQSDGEPVD